MKKVPVFLIVICLLQAHVVFAGPLYRPTLFVGRGHIDGGVQWGAVFKERFEVYDLNRAYADGTADTVRKGADFEDDRYYLVTVTYGLFDRLNVFVRLGLVDGGKWQDCEAGNNWEGNLENSFVWAVGIKGKIHEFENGLGLGLAAQYMRYDNREVNGWRCLDTGESARELGWSTDDTVDYWKLDVTATAWWTVGAFTPYVAAGLTYDDVRFKGLWTHKNPLYGWASYDASFRNENNLTRAPLCHVQRTGHVEPDRRTPASGIFHFPAGRQPVSFFRGGDHHPRAAGPVYQVAHSDQ